MRRAGRDPHRGGMKRTRHLIVAISTAVVVGVSLPHVARSSTTTHLGTVTVGQGVVVLGPTVKAADMFWEACDTAVGDCFTYSVDVAPGGARLRAMIDSTDNGDIWGVRLRAPNGRLIEALRVDPTEVAHSALGTNAWTTEVAPVENPEPGRWELLVVPAHVRAGTFRLRMQLDGAHVDAPGAQLPNLTIVPAFAFTFAAPAQQIRPPGGNLVAPSPLAIGDEQPVSCLADETAEQGVTRCLRFGLGVGNNGDGPVDLRFARGETSGVMRQHVRGDMTVYDGGPRYEIHGSHLHFHNRDMARTVALRVANKPRGRPRLEPVTSSTKHGFCLDDSIILEIDRSNSDPQYGERSSCEIVAANTDDPAASDQGRMVINRGWGDIYPNYLSGMYVDFDGLAKGDYVLQSTADPDGRVVESDETDNTAYTWIHVDGDDVVVRERGYGLSPWDAHKIVIAPSAWIV